MDEPNCVNASSVPQVQESLLESAEEARRKAWYQNCITKMKKRRCHTCKAWYKPTTGNQRNCPLHFVRRKRGPNHSNRAHKERQIECGFCERPFVSIRGNQKYCSKPCFKRQQRKMSYTEAETEFRHLCTQSTGNAAELLTGVDALLKGLMPFRAMSHASPYDLVICDAHGRPWKIQVKKGRRLQPTNNSGSVRIAYEQSTYKIPKGTDVLALVVLAQPTHVHYVKPLHRSTFYMRDYWKFWEEPLCPNTQV